MQAMVVYEVGTDRRCQARSGPYFPRRDLKRVIPQNPTVGPLYGNPVFCPLWKGRKVSPSWLLSPSPAGLHGVVLGLCLWWMGTTCVSRNVSIVFTAPAPIAKTPAASAGKY